MFDNFLEVFVRLAGVKCLELVEVDIHVGVQSFDSTLVIQLYEV